METASDICEQFHAFLPNPDFCGSRLDLTAQSGCQCEKRKISLFTATTETGGNYADGRFTLFLISTQVNNQRLHHSPILVYKPR